MVTSSSTGPSGPPIQKPGYYAIKNEEGVCVAFYHEAVHGYKMIPAQRPIDPSNLDPMDLPHLSWDLVPNELCLIPEEAVSITDEEYETYFPSEEIAEDEELI